jgi:ribosomal protein L16 Arg81 hydroxylase
VDDWQLRPAMNLHPALRNHVLQEEAKKKARAQRFNLPKSKAELDREAKEKAAALAAELAEKKRQRGERFGTLSEVRASHDASSATPCPQAVAPWPR